MTSAGLVAVSFTVVIALETLLLGWVSREKNPSSILRTVLWSHLPWFLGWCYPWVLGLVLPEPHNFDLRKLQVLLGIILVAHLFLFTRSLLVRSYGKGWRTSRIFGLAAAVLFAGITLWTGTVCEPSGDEPHYLLMAYSLIHDGDLDLSNNYQNKDYERFYHRGVLEPQALEHVIEGRRYSHHPLGPVLLVLPGFAIAGRLGAALTMALLAAFALFLTLRVLEETGAGGWPLHATGIIGLFSSPLLLFSGLIYPEIPTACLVALSLLLFLRQRWGWLGICFGLMLWMHNRNVLILIPFLLIAAWEIKKSGKGWLEREWKLAAGMAVPLMILVIYFYRIYGVLTPLGAHNEPFHSLFSLHHFWIGFFGLIFDQECGLCFHYPIFALMVTGAGLLVQARNPLRVPVIGVFVFFFLFMSFYENLGLTPAARYMVGVTPLLLILIHPMVGMTKKGTFGFYTTLLAFASGTFVNGVLAAVPWMRYNKLNGENWILKITGNYLRLNLTAGAPSFQTPVIQWQSYAISIFWIVLTVVLSVLFLLNEARKRRIK